MLSQLTKDAPLEEPYLREAEGAAFAEPQGERLQDGHPLFKQLTVDSAGCALGFQGEVRQDPNAKVLRMGWGLGDPCGQGDQADEDVEEPETSAIRTVTTPLRGEVRL